MELSYRDRIQYLHDFKVKQVEMKRERYGPAAGTDDSAKVVVDPASLRFRIQPSDASGGVFGDAANGKNFRRFLEQHPTFIDPMSSLAGAEMVYYFALRSESGPTWNPAISYAHLKPEIERYILESGIGASQHFNMDIEIGLKLGWRGILGKIGRAQREDDRPEASRFRSALTDVVLGIQDLIARHADAAGEAAARAEDPVLRASLSEMARINRKLVSEPPDSFHEACQWVAWYVMVARMYNSGGAGGAIDQYLYPYYRRDLESGETSPEQATFHLACLLAKSNAYYQIGGVTPEGADASNELSFLMIEAIHQLNISTCVCLRVSQNQNPALLKLAVRYLFEDQNGSPSFIGEEATSDGFAKNGYPIELARTRAKVGCHWCSLPGTEYSLNDQIKIDLVRVFDTALRDMLGDPTAERGSEELWRRFENHLRRAVAVLGRSFDFHCDHMKDVFPDLVLDLLCHGTIERGLDASGGGVEHHNVCIDAAGLATVADSFGAIADRIERERKIGWDALLRCLDANFEGAEATRLLLATAPRFGLGDTAADAAAARIKDMLTRLVKENKTPKGFNMIPGFFSWTMNMVVGANLGATPNGRRAGEPISHGANPEPGAAKQGGITALALALASVQCGYGNSSPLQLEVDPILGKDEQGVLNMTAFLRAYFGMGGTLVNLNVLGREKLMDAYAHPERYPDLVVRVTGYSAYFALLTSEYQKMIVDRMISA